MAERLDPGNPVDANLVAITLLVNFSLTFLAGSGRAQDTEGTVTG